MKLTPVKYDVCCNPIVNGGLMDPNMSPTQLRGSMRITIESRSMDGSKWAISNGNSCFSKSQIDFVYEPLPSSLEDDFLDDTRFDSAEEALAFWKKYWEHYAYSCSPLFRWEENGEGVKRAELTEEDRQKIEVARTGSAIKKDLR